ncbi:MAG: hypothetical protein ACI9QL_001700 [Candidatus Omnitrophota bacterium]|jgi:hypothetical protein
MALLFLCNSCVYLRLNTLRKQLAHFDKYCTYVDHDGPALLFKEPIVKTGDVKWLFGFEQPSEIDAGEKRQVVRYILKKLWPDARREGEQDFSIICQFAFEKERMTEIGFPHGFDDVLTEEVINQMFKKADDAEISKTSGTSRWEMGAKAEFPALSEVLKISGRPFERSLAEGVHTLVFDYHLKGQDSPPEQVDCHTVMTFGEKDERMISVHVRIGTLYLDVDTTKDHKYKMTMKRSEDTEDR